MPSPAVQSGYSTKTVLSWVALGVVGIVSYIMIDSHTGAMDQIKANGADMVEHRAIIGHTGIIERTDAMQRQLKRIENGVDALLRRGGGTE